MSGGAEDAEPRRIRVVVRLRPASGPTALKVDSGAKTITVPGSRGRRPSAESAGGLYDHAAQDYGLRFRVDQIYDAAASQRAVFEGEVASLVGRCVLEGDNATLLAYGQTGAGKTHTVLGQRGSSGSSSTYDQRGMVPRALERVFELAAQRRRGGASVDVRLSVLEVYNETLIDLLSEKKHGLNAEPSAAALSVVERHGGGVEVRGLSLVPAHSSEEALQLIYDAEINRAVGSHAMNLTSSRSHLVVTAHLTVRQERRRRSIEEEDGPEDDEEDLAEERVTRSKLHLVDLAGSERTKATASRDATATVREAGYINKSLSFLEQVVIALGDVKREHVPFRSSKLTQVLRDSLGGLCRTTLVACLWPEVPQLDQTQCTLRFAARMSRVACAAVRDEDREAELAKRGRGAIAAKLRHEVDALRAELALHDLIAAKRPARPELYAYGSLSKAQVERAKREAGAYLLDEAAEPSVVTVAQIRAVYAALRQVAVAALEKQQDKKGLVRELTGVVETTPAHSQQQPATTEREDDDDNFERGGARDSQSRQSGRSSTPAAALALTAEALEAHSKSLEEEPAPAPVDASSSAAAFEAWRARHAAGENAEPEGELVSCRQAAKEAKRRLKESTADVNNAKRAIDALVLRIQAARAEAAEDADDDANADVDDAPEALLVRRLKEVKAEYRAAFHELTKLKAEAQHAEARGKLVYRELVVRFSEATGLSVAQAAAAHQQNQHHAAPTDVTSEISGGLVARVRPY